jgi:hypothetical protein
MIKNKKMFSFVGTVFIFIHLKMINPVSLQPLLDTYL